MFGPVVIPAPADDFVALARDRRATGRTFKKHILNLGPLIHPQSGKVLQLDENWFNQLKSNFDAKVCPIVQVPLADEKNAHSEAPERNIGEVIDVRREGNKVFAIIDARGNLPGSSQPAADSLGTTLLGASAFLHMNYADTRTGRKVGPTLLHVAVTNRPYVTDLDDFESVHEVAASAAAAWEWDDEIVTLTAPTWNTAMLDPVDQEMLGLAETGPVAASEMARQLAGNLAVVNAPTEELLAELRHRGVPVSSREAADAALSMSLSMQDAQAEARENEDELELTVRQNEELRLTVEQLQLSQAQTRVDHLIRNGYLVPTQAETMLELAMHSPDQFEALIPARPLIAMSAPVGTSGTPQGEDKHEAEIVRLSDPDGPSGRMFSGTPQRGRRLSR